MTQQVLNIRGLSVALPKTADRPFAVEDLSLQINAGETLCVVGESGSGKSVTAHAVMRLLPERVLQIQSGEIFLNGKNILDINIEAFRRLRGAWVSMIFQEPMTALNPLMRIGDQIEEALLAHSQQDKSTAREKVLESLREMHLPDPESLQYCYPFQLSGGQRQRVMIAMAMITKPFLLIADEPTTALDVTTQAQILNLIDELKEKHNIAVLFITHDFGVVADIADRVVVMQHGKVVEQGIASQVLHHPQHDYTKKLISALPKIRFGKHFEKKAPEPLLRIEKLNKTYKARGSGLFSRATKRFQALKDVDLHIEVGESLGILGESGSGKTTLGHCVARLLDADSGKIIFAGEDLCQLSAAKMRRLRPKIQMIFQDPYSSLNPRHRVDRIIMENALLHGISKQEAERRMFEILDLVGLSRRAANRYPHEFSGGQRQRIGIARALIMEPSLIIADEPVSALDVSVQKQVLELLAHVRERYQLSMLFITHDLRVASEVCDRIAVMSQGQIVECRHADDIYRSPEHAYTRALINAIPGGSEIQELEQSLQPI